MKTLSSNKQKSQKLTDKDPYPGLSKEWVDLSKRLALVISDLDEDEYLVISEKMRNVYVQFYSQGYYGMRMEAVGNDFLKPSDRLTKDAVQILSKIGWLSPTYKKAKAKSEPPVGSCNYYIDFDKPVPYSMLADIAIMTLQYVYCTRHPGSLQYKAVGPTHSVRFPTLGLKREAPGDTISE